MARFHAERWTRFTSVKRVRRSVTFGEITGDQLRDGARATYLPCINLFFVASIVISLWSDSHGCSSTIDEWLLNSHRGPGAHEVAATNEGNDDSISVKIWLIHQAGLRLPMSPLLKKVMAHSHLTFMQVSMNSVQTVLAIDALMRWYEEEADEEPKVSSSTAVMPPKVKNLHPDAPISSHLTRTQASTLTITQKAFLSCPKHTKDKGKSVLSYRHQCHLGWSTSSERVKELEATWGVEYRLAFDQGWDLAGDYYVRAVEDDRATVEANANAHGENAEGGDVVNAHNDSLVS
ncbi:hypothetical protein Acr_17g0007960 [Actinidia rufa]|uniref:Uncharacterized protein n=1 Tax=Actinidia rufa TaxID=165716 RepID=A0A7J0G365_9ERIC|nr:hypothetical protein Acr_17g0007960 [Actinidia rufa]